MIIVSKLKDMTGKKFNKLTVISRAENSNTGQARWNCKCECGNVIAVDGFALRIGNTRSCGCLKKEITTKRNTTHGKSKTRIYRIYTHLKERCYSKNDKRYDDYGGRGIKVCDEWLHDFMSFYNWSMDNGYTDDLSLDRIDVNNDYCPENCRWVTIKIQENNRRNNHILTYNGETKTLSQWSEITGIRSQTILRRIKLGWNTHDALTTKVNEKYSHRK